MIGKTEAVTLYMISEGIGSVEELKAVLPISDSEVEGIIRNLEQEGYLVNSNGLKLTKRGFEVLMDEEVVKMVSEVRKHIETLASDDDAREEIERLISEEDVLGKVGEAKLFLQRLEEERNAEPVELGKTEIVILYLISEGVSHSVDIKTLLPISASELDRLLEKLEMDGYLEKSDGFKLTKKGFDALLEHSREVKDYVEDYLKKKAQKVSEVKRLIEKLTSDEVEVKSGIRYYLSPEEEILSHCKDSLTGYEFYATNARILRYRATTKGEDFAELSYSEIDGLTLSTGRDVRLLAVGGAVIALGVLGIGVPAFLLGLGAVGLYLYRSSVFYEFVGKDSLEKKKVAKSWRIYDTESKEVQEFVRTVREEISKRKLRSSS
ncbi:hypothetical protein [Archaeoglobus sp.]|uniref:hypothetical protein n=1 Tax=Archaeoglobus sp. TaxID=1872626 RepID=UPI0024AC5397|nr:hypothetical protein [Archaeoglobus sp.]MDI3496855.1 hypothetical protein [Archaeoglobus sp.]